MNKKIKKIIFLLIISFTFLMSSCNNKQNVHEEFVKNVTKLDSYVLEGTYISHFPNNKKESKIVVKYQKPDKFYVEINSQSKSLTQTIIKNSQGVFITIPSLNKSFEIKSDWPYNKSYPYLLSSIAKDINTNQNIIQRKDNGKYIIDISIDLFEDDKIEKETIVFNTKTKMIENVYIYDSEDNIISEFIVTKFTKNPKLKSTDFDVKNTLETLKTDIVEFDRSITYPTYYPQDSFLASQIIDNKTDNIYGILKYSGSAKYTIIEEAVFTSSNLFSPYVDADIYVFGNCVGFITDNMLTFYDNGMKYIVASDMLEISEIIKMADSLVTTYDK